MSIDAIFIFLLIIAIVKNIDCGESCREVPPERKTSFLWKISSDSLIAESYLFGTVHVNYKDVWDAVSFETKQALFGSNAVFLEISNGDARNLTGEIGCKNLENSKKLQEFLSEADYELVENFMQKLYSIIKTNQDEDFVNYLNYTILGNWQNKKPLALFIELEQFFGDMSVPEFSQAFTEIVLDDYIEMLGQHFNKTTGSVENPERECYIYEDPIEETWLLKYLPKHFDLSNVSMVNVSSSSEEVIKDELYNETTKFLNDYKCGIFNLDMDEHDISLKIEDVTKEDQVKLQRLNQKLQNAFYKRNFNMATKIHNLLTQNSSLSHFFALGYGHFFGKNNVRTLLEVKYGYKINEVKKSKILNNLWRKIEDLNAETPSNITSKNIQSFKNRINNLTSDSSSKEEKNFAQHIQFSIFLLLFKTFVYLL